MQQNPSGEFQDRRLQQKRKSSLPEDSSSCKKVCDEQLPPIDSLPNEILAYIFSFLDIQQHIGIELVCWRWQRLPWSEPRRLIFDPNQNIENPLKKLPWNDVSVAAILLRCGSCVRQLTLVKQNRGEIDFLFNESISEDSLEIIGQQCPNLEEITLKNFNLREKALTRIAQGCSKLKIVHFSNFGHSDKGFLPFYKHCKVLESLTLNQCEPYQEPVRPIRGDGFEEINPHLKTLNLVNCGNLHVAALQKLVHRCDCLRELRLSVTFNEMRGLAFSLFLDVLDHFQNSLTVLDFKMDTLGFDWCHALSLLSKLEELYLNVEGLRYQCSRHAEGHCYEVISKHLRVFNLDGRWDFADQPKAGTLFLQKIIDTCDHLEELRFETNILSLHPSVLFKYSDSLKIFNLVEYAKTEWNWCELFAGLLGLEKVDLMSIGDINDNVLECLAKNCSYLRHLVVCRTDVTDKGLAHLSLLPQLTILDASFCKGINGRGIEILAAQGNLEELHVASSFETLNLFMDISDDNCIPLAKSCPNFCLLNVSNNSRHISTKITDRLVASFCASIEGGVLRKHVQLFVGGTSVSENVTTCDRLSLSFEKELDCFEYDL